MKTLSAAVPETSPAATIYLLGQLLSITRKGVSAF
jgi:hypothetical protein